MQILRNYDTIKNALYVPFIDIFFKEAALELTVTELNGFTIIKINGKVDWESARILDKKIHELIDAGSKHVVFNLDEVTFICSGGIGALVYNLNKVKKQGGAMYIISSNEYVNYILETLKFDIVFDGFLFKSFEEFRDKVVEKD
jgi:anti-anti-sigma factor